MDYIWTFIIVFCNELKVHSQSKKIRQAIDFWMNYVIIFSADNTVQNMSRCCDTIYYLAWQTVLALWFVLRFLKSRKERILIYD